ncbi:MAG: hypothetical protein QG670_2270 [Thermoproteota archaeon]|nr:hypothetical protein [Thermoproteota archaeon]
MDSPFPNISVVIVNLNGKQWLSRCIPSVLGSDYPEGNLEIILVDNGSADGSVEFVEKSYPKIRIERLVKNVGWSPANNEGIKLSKGDIIVCLSNDMEVNTTWLREIASFMVNHRNVGIVQCNSISMWDRKTFDSSMNYLDRFGYSYGYAPERDPREVFFAEGMAFAVRREVVNKMGLFDNYYFMEYDDMDFSWRARLAGYKIYFLPSAVVYHARGGTVGRTYFERLKNVEWYTRNHFVTIIKNYETKNLVMILPVVFFIEISKALYLLVMRRNLQVAIAALRGILQVLKDSKTIFRKRGGVQSIRRVGDKEVMKVMHPFMPLLIYSFLAAQSKGKRFIQSITPPINPR